jgi:hypothetical protein
MVRRRGRARIGESIWIGPFRFRISFPLGRGRTWVSAGTRTGRGRYTSVSAPVGERRRGR